MTSSLCAIDFSASAIHGKEILWLRHALALARRSSGNSGSRPPVGCVVVCMEREVIVARGRTRENGTLHAEAAALASMPERKQGEHYAAYVTLEPCSSRSLIGAVPCIELLHQAGCKRIVYGLPDPNPDIDSQPFMQRTGLIGISLAQYHAQKTLNHNMTPAAQCLLKDINDFYAPYTTRTKGQRSFVTVKIASSLDGKIALANGQSKWITSQKSRDTGQLLRRDCDVIIVGRNTVTNDTPRLDCRLPGLTSLSPAVLVIDSQCSFDPDNGGAQLVNRAVRNGAHVEIACSITAPKEKIAELQKRNIIVSTLPQSTPRRINVQSIMTLCHNRGWQRVLIEGGGTLIAEFIKADLVDEIFHFSGGLSIGSSGINSVGQLDLPSIDSAQKFVATEVRTIGADVLTRWIKSSF